jgi:hypothetical protein
LKSRITIKNTVAHWRLAYNSGRIALTIRSLCRTREFGLPFRLLS